jgi:ubiquinone/menaquinone biosynthesis C-methylase UbiE
MKPSPAQPTWDHVAKRYDEAAFTFDPFAEALVEAAQVNEGEKVLDVGCGTGISTFPAAARVGAAGRVVGLDLAEPMLRAAACKEPETAGPVGFVQGRAEALPFPAGTFDVALCNFGPHLFADPPQGLREMARVLRPGGRLAVTVPAPQHVEEFVDRFLAVLAREGLLREFLARGPLRSSPERATRMLAAAGLDQAIFTEKTVRFPLTNAAQYADVLAAWGAKNRMLRRLPEAVRERLWQATVTDLEHYARGSITITCACFVISWTKGEGPESRPTEGTGLEAPDLQGV